MNCKHITDITVYNILYKLYILYVHWNSCTLHFWLYLTYLAHFCEKDDATEYSIWGLYRHIPGSDYASAHDGHTVCASQIPFQYSCWSMVICNTADLALHVIQSRNATDWLLHVASCWVWRITSRITAIGSPMDGIPPEVQRLIENCHCLKTFETAKGKKERCCHQNSKLHRAE